MLRPIDAGSSLTALGYPHPLAPSLLRDRFYPASGEGLSSAAKVARWFELLQTPAPLSRPESGFVSGAQSGDLGGSEEVPADAEADAATDAATDADALAVSDALSRLPARKRKKLFKLKLGRNVTF
ncbi:hypothetical protein FOCC_FOCC008847 [Frankliniella occidentalis]|nr:hypothetical protein FOCC_FOCC008847 [Frankliniella occidentalis]